MGLRDCNLVVVAIKKENKSKMGVSFDREKLFVFTINIGTEQLQNSVWILLSLLHTIILTAKCFVGHHKVRIVSMN